MNNWFQIISNVAIIVGLGLVIYELNQSKQLAHVQALDELFSRMTNRRLAMVGEDPRTSLARAALRPNELTEEDVVALEEIYTEVVVNWANSARARQVGGIDRNVEAQISSEAAMYFTTEPGRRWFTRWAARREDVPTVGETVKIAERVLQRKEGNHYKDIYELLLAKY